MHDVLPQENQIQRFIIEKAREIAFRYGFRSMSTPIIEEKDLFVRAMGDDTDVVSKELYHWTQSKQEVALRPEGTAGILRSILSPAPLQYSAPDSTKALPPQSHRVFYAGPMFRHERPQKGRYRQFDQLGVEWIGEGASGPNAELQLLSMAHHFLSSLDVSYELQINSIGNQTERAMYREVLKDYFLKYRSELSEVSQQRLERGSVIRLLDSKDPVDKQIAQSAPSILDHLTPESKTHFDRVRKGLEILNIPYQINPLLVRGLDYYSHVIFEFLENQPKTESSSLGASQNTILAGGRYDQLSTTLGGHPLSAIGWAAGVDRIGLILNKDLLPTERRPVVLILARAKDESDELLESFALKLSHSLCSVEGLQVLFAGEGTVGRQFSRANKYNAQLVVIIGMHELQTNQITLRWMDEKKETQVAVEDLEEFLRNNL